MHTTVYFATNRAANAGSPEPAEAFSERRIAVDGGKISYGVAMVENTDPDPEALSQRRVTDIVDRTTDGFSQGVQDDIVGAGKDLLVFVHGFANSFSDALCRAAFNREWFAAGAPGADCTVIAFTWPSAGRVVNGRDVLPGIVDIGFTLLSLALHGRIDNPLTNAYLTDQQNARNSGRDLLRFLAGLAPVVSRTRAAGHKVHLLAHSMGHVVLEAAFANLFGSGERPAWTFDEAVLAAADTAAQFADRAPRWVTSMPTLASRTSIYHSDEDRILLLSDLVNGSGPRLGYNGPAQRQDRTLFPASRFTMVDCSALEDTGDNGGVDASHQYYRRLPPVRDHIAGTLAGEPRPAVVKLEMEEA